MWLHMLNIQCVLSLCLTNFSYGHYNLDARKSVFYYNPLILKNGKSLPPNICGVSLLQLMIRRLKRPFTCNFSYMNFLINRV